MEIEAKFRAPDAEVLRRLGDEAELAGYPLSAGQTEDVSDTYLDTPDWRIMAAGFSCRRRTSSGGVVVTVKQLSSPQATVHRREEFEVRLAQYVSPQDWPESQTRAMVIELIGGAALQEMLVLRQTRVKRLLGPAGAPVAELSLDKVRMAEGDSSGEAGRGMPKPAERTYFEVEIELMKAGTERDLEALASALTDELHLELEPLSKFERALAIMQAVPDATVAPPGVVEAAAAAPAAQADAVEAPDQVGADAGQPEKAPESPGDRRKKRSRRSRFLGDGLEILEKPGLIPDDSMAEAADKTLLFHLQRMMKHEPGTRDGEDPEELHDMRVATRRMRAALRVFEDHLDMEEFGPFLRLLRKTGRELGTVRDLDVFRIKTQIYIDSLPPEQRNGLDPLLEAWAREREKARAEMITFLDGGRYQHFKESFEHFLRTPGAGAGRTSSAEGEPLPTRVRDVLPVVVFTRFANVRAFQESVSRPDPSLASLHQLRISCKGLRYSLEFFQEVLGPGSKPLIETTKVVQDHLGDLQDAVVTCDVLLGFLGSGTWGLNRQPKKEGRPGRPIFPINAPGVAAYLTVRQNEIESLVRTFGPVWQQISSPEFSRPLAELVGAL